MRKAAKAWANALPFGNVAQLHDAVTGSAAGAGDGVLQRASGRRSPKSCATRWRTCTPSWHDAAGKPQPAVDRELEAAEQAIALWNALWEQCSACLKPLLRRPELAGVKPKLLQRGLYVGKQLIVAHGLARRATPPALWQELHAYYRLAEMLECAVTAVIGRPAPERRGHIVLFDLQPRAAVRPRRPLRDDGEADRARRPLAGDVGARSSPCAAARIEGPVLIVDLDSTQGAALVIADAGGSAGNIAPSATRPSSRPACAGG
ncbi:MAG: hypothetical protein IPF60_11295 [Betaproteobacteria bacterium]|nr:hypothetical protein [Betaproteobacteria bacterium]